MMFQQFIVLFLGLALAQSFELSFLEDIDSAIITTCKESNNLSDEDVQVLSDNSQGCSNAFEASDKGRCFHMCIVKALGYVNTDGGVDQVKLQKLYFWLKPDFIKMAWTKCSAEYKDSTDKCPGYYIHKCLSIAFGLYPLKTLHVPTLNIQEITKQECLEAYKITDAELCSFESDLVVDQFGENERASCYHACILEKKGFVLNEDAIVDRLYYITNIKEVYAKCTVLVKELQIESRCKRIYNMHKCVKREIKEFPVPDSIY